MKKATSKIMVTTLGLMLAAVVWAGPSHAPKAAEAARKSSPRPTRVVIETSKGTIEAELFADKTPQTVSNFITYIKAGFYKDLVFHRVIPGFMIQGGGFDAHLRPRQVRAPIVLEAGRGLSNRRGTLAMARTGDPNSATSQFFINLVDNTQLDNYGGGYAVFGQVTKGMEVVDAIAKVPTQPQRGHQNAPVEPVLIRSIKLH